MGLLKKRGDSVHPVVQDAFSRVKNDTEHIFQWLHHFMRQHEGHDIRLALLENQENGPNTSQNSEIDTLRSYVGQLHTYMATLERGYRPLHEKLQQLEVSLSAKKRESERFHEKALEFHQRLELLENARNNAEIQRSLHALNTRIEKIETIKPSIEQSNLVSHVAKRVERQSKKYLQSVILQLIQKHGELSGTQIREIVVEDQKLTSKSSLYRALGVLEANDRLSVSRRSKEKVYALKNVAIMH